MRESAVSSKELRDLLALLGVAVARGRCLLAARFAVASGLERVLVRRVLLDRGDRRLGIGGRGEAPEVVADPAEEAPRLDGVALLLGASSVEARLRLRGERRDELVALLAESTRE